MSLAELMSSSIIFWDTTRALTCMFLTSRLSSLFWKLLHAFRIRWFCERYTSVTWFACLFHVFFVCWRTFQTSESLLDLDHTNEVRGLQLYEASCVSRRILQNLRKSSFRSSRRNWNFMRHSHEKSRRGQNSGLNCSPSFSLTLSNPFIDVEHFLVRLCNGKRVECKLNCFSINYLYDVFVVLEMSFPSFRGLSPLRYHRIFPRHRRASEKTWTSVSCIFDNSLSIRSILS